MVVKRKRTVWPDAEATVERQRSSEESTVRAPRVFRVDGSTPPPTKPVKDLPTVQRLRARRRRVLHGAVTTIRPATADSGADRGPGSEPHEGVLAFLDFGVGEEERRRYKTLMNKIAELQLQAKTAKESEAAAAVRWIRKAIAEYGICRSELGF